MQIENFPFAAATLVDWRKVGRVCLIDVVVVVVVVFSLVVGSLAAPTTTAAVAAAAASIVPATAKCWPTVELCVCV